jgi:dienelactone hydrolase
VPQPYDTLFAKITYPATFTGSAVERNTGVLAADPARAPYPVVLLLSGINVGKEAYQWLAVALAQAGIVTITYDWIAEDLPGYISLTAGVDLGSLGPGIYGTRPTSTVVGPLLGLVDALNADGVLAGLLNRERIILGGHSAGATMALQNANPAWFPQVKGAFGYAGHTMASTLFGYEAGTILPVLSDLPLLVLGGSADGVIASSSGRYGLQEGSATAALERTFDEGVRRGALAVLQDADHFLIAHPHDTTMGRGFLEAAPPVDRADLRAFSAELIIAFIRESILNEPSRLLDYLQRPEICLQRTK